MSADLEPPARPRRRAQRPGQDRWRLAGDPAAYERQSMAALDEYRSRFDPVDAGKRLRAIYDQALLA